VKDAITDKAAFEVLATRFANLEKADWNKQHPPTAILEALNEIIQFVNTHAA
jgi:hypothetical protein